MLSPAGAERGYVAIVPKRHSDYISRIARAIARATVYGVLVGFILFAWGLVITARIYGASGEGAAEQNNAWTPALLAPVIVAYLSSIAGVIWPRPILWPLMPAVVTAATFESLLVHVLVDDAFRAYEPERLWLMLFVGAPIAAFVAGLAESLRFHS